MGNDNFTVRFTVTQPPQAAFAAINNVRGWWSEAIDGPTDKLGGEFDYHYQDIHRCKIRVTELVPNSKVVWRVLDNYFSFTQDSTEWTGTQIVFDISRSGDRTEVRLTHEGLVAADECYDACSEGWTTYITKSLKALIETGKGMPNVGDPLTSKERALTA